MMVPVSVSGLLVSEEARARMREIDPRDPILHADMFDTMVKYYNPDGTLPQYILGKADEDDYTGFPKVVMYFDAPPPTRSGSAAAPRWNPEDSRGLVAPAFGSGATAIRRWATRYWRRRFSSPCGRDRAGL